MPDVQRIDPVLVEKAMRAAYDVAPQYDGSTGRPKTYEECYGVAPLDHMDDREEMEAVIQSVLDELGLKERIINCNCNGGRYEEGPPGATYTVVHDRCGGTGRVVQLAGRERPVEQGDAK